MVGAALWRTQQSPPLEPSALEAYIKHLTYSERACYTRGMLGRDNLEGALRALGDVLDDRGLSARILVAGGSSLLLLALIDRVTADVDVIGFASGERYVKAEEIPPALASAVRDVGAALGLGDGWLNNGPASLFDFGLPVGFEARVSVRRYGGLEVHIPGRVDLLAFKLYAAVDQFGSRDSKQMADLRALEPTPEELLTAARWTRTHDPSEGYQGELIKALASLGVEASDADL